jgi:hypothetical protein
MSRRPKFPAREPTMHGDDVHNTEEVGGHRMINYVIIRLDSFLPLTCTLVLQPSYCKSSIVDSRTSKHGLDGWFIGEFPDLFFVRTSLTMNVDR